MRTSATSSSSTTSLSSSALSSRAALYAHKQSHTNKQASKTSGTMNGGHSSGSSSSGSASASGHSSDADLETSTATTPFEEQVAPLPVRFKWETKSWLEAGSEWDLSGAKELSNLVRAGTAQAHKTVESSPMVGKILRASLPVDIHIKFLVMLYQIYDALEIALSEHAAHFRLAKTYNPSVLARADVLGQDITYFLGLKPSEDWKEHPSAKTLLDNPPEALLEYVHRIQALGRSDGSLPSIDKHYTYPPPPAQEWLLLAHAYVRYLGDLNGGQTIKNSVAKAYGLDTSALDGLRFFDFDGPDGAVASAAELSRLTSSFRKGIDSTGDMLTPEERAAFLQEANHAFELNMRLFTSFEKTGDVQAVNNKLTSNAMPAPASDKFAKASNYAGPRVERAAKSSPVAADQLSKKASSVLPIPLWLLFLAVVLPAYLVARPYLTS